MLYEVITTVSAKKFGEFYITIFDEWVKKDVGKYFIQLFDSALAGTVGEQPGVCIFGETVITSYSIHYTKLYENNVCREQQPELTQSLRKSYNFV